MVKKGGCQSTCVAGQPFPPSSGKQRPCRDAGVGAIAPGFAMLARAKRASHIDPPPSSYAIIRRARPYRGENPGPGKDVHGELDHRPGIRERLETGPAVLDAAGEIYGDASLEGQAGRLRSKRICSGHVSLRNYGASARLCFTAQPGARVRYPLAATVPLSYRLQGGGPRT